MSDEEKRSLDVTWNNLPDYTDSRNALVVVDGSGSMLGLDANAPINVAVSLGLYFAERNTGKFKNMYMTFGARPKMVTVPDCNIYDKVQYCMQYNDWTNTDIMSVYNKLLDAAITSGASQDEMPETVYIVSDMEFDQACSNPDKSTFQLAKEKFENAGYKLPPIVFWNV